MAYQRLSDIGPSTGLYPGKVSEKSNESMREELAILRKKIKTDESDKIILKREFEVVKNELTKKVDEIHTEVLFMPGGAISKKLAKDFEDKQIINSKLKDEDNNEEIDKDLIEESFIDDKKDERIIDDKKDEKPSIDVGDECSFCLVEKKNVVFFPCKHMCVCNGCCDENVFDVCPICKEKITEKHKIFV